MFWFVLRLVLAAGSIFVILNITTPIVYSVWYDNLREGVTFSNLQTTGDVFFGNFLIMSYVVPGIIIIWGFIIAQRKRVQQIEDVFD